MCQFTLERIGSNHVLFLHRVAAFPITKFKSLITITYSLTQTYEIIISNDFSGIMDRVLDVIIMGGCK